MDKFYIFKESKSRKADKLAKQYRKQIFKF